MVFHSPPLSLIGVLYRLLDQAYKYRRKERGVVWKSCVPGYNMFGSIESDEKLAGWLIRDSTRAVPPKMGSLLLALEMQC